MSPTLLVPGHQDIGPGHWLSLWDGARADVHRVVMPNWAFPRKTEWMEALDEAIAACSEPPILVGHALGSLTIVHWAAQYQREIRGALLAAPLDVERPDAPAVVRGFAPIPRGTLPFPTILAASSTDAGLELGRARSLAVDWGARFVDLGPCGHLNQASGHGPWPLGEALLQELH